MHYLLIDNSNSRTKFILSNKEKLIGEVYRINTDSISERTLHELLESLSFDSVLIGSVVPAKAQVLAHYFLHNRGVSDVHFLTYSSSHGIGFEFPNPEQIGADRIANAVAVCNSYKTPSIVIDFGTAVTFDVITEGAVYRGGVIAPGLGSMNDYLSAKTALLPRIDLNKPEKAIGESTIEAMQSGAFFGYKGLIKGIIEAISKELEHSPQVISTGGDGKFFSDEVEEIDLYSEMLTLEGLRIVANNTFGFGKREN